PYTLSTVVVPAVPATENSPAVPKHKTVETLQTMSPKNKAHYKSEKEAIHLILTGIGDEIYSTVDTCKTTQEMWEAIKRQDVKTNLYWEFGKFTSHDGETMESYYTRFYKMMNEMIRSNLTIATIIARNANPLALVATAQSNQDPCYQTPKSHKPYAPTSKASILTRSHATTKHKGKEIAKPITPPSESASEEDSDPEQAQRDKDMLIDKMISDLYVKDDDCVFNQANICKKIWHSLQSTSKSIYKPTNNNLRTSSNSRNKNVDTIPRYNNVNQSVQFRNQRIITVAEARENVGSPVLQQTGIQCFNCKEFGHFAKECRKPKRVKDFTYHKKKMLLCKQAEQGVLLQAEQSDWLANTEEEINKQELEAHYSFMEKIQEVVSPELNSNAEPLEQVQNDDEYNVFANVNQYCEQSESTSNTCLVEKDDINVTPDSPDMCENDIQTDQNAEDERVALANLKLDTEFEKFKACNDRTVDYDKLRRKFNGTLGLLAQKDIDIKEGLVKEKIKVITDLKQKEDKDIDKIISMEKQLKFLNEIVYKRNQTIQTIYMLAPKGQTFNDRPTFANLMYPKKAQSEKPCLYEIPNDQADPTNRLVPDKEETLTLAEESQSKLNRPYDYIKLNSLYEIFKPAIQGNHEQLAHVNEVRKKMWRKSFVKQNRIFSKT
nr:hypothetical protein [Tanacetum cinerariifolium]